MKKIFRSKKFLGISSLVLATSLVVGTIAIRRSKDGNGFNIGSSTVYADGSLLDYDSASLINYSTILGRAIDYGILSDTVDQKGHMETTYATNKFINPQAANNCDVDLAGSKPAQFIIASVESGSYARFGQTYAMSEMDFVIDTTYDMAAHEDDNFVYDDSCKANVLYRTYDYSVLKQNVDSMIGKIVKQSDILAAKSAFDGDTIATKRGDSGATIDLSDPQFKDATIYINVKGGSNLEKAIQKSDGLLIIKDPSTNVVFNMLGTGPLELCQYRMQIVGEDFALDTVNGKEHSDHSFDSTTTCSGEDSLHNAHVEKYMTKSIIWNIRNASSVKYNTTAGLFLVPTNITGDVTGSSAGWIASAGRTIVSAGEFHYIHHDRSDLGNTTDTSVLHFAARKGFVSSYARNAQGEIEELTNVKLSEGEYTFSFTETESDYTTPKEGGVSELVNSVDGNSKVLFPDIIVDVKTIDPNIPQKRYFVVKENPTTPSDPNIELSKGEIDIELTIENIDGIIHYTVNTKKYFTEKTSPNQTEDDGDTNIQASGAEFSLGAFLNKYNKKEAELTLKKAISGDAPDANKKYNIGVKKGSQFVQADGSLGGHEYYFQVPADGTGIKIEGLVPGEYTIVENEGNLQGYNLTGTTMSATITAGGSTAGPDDITSDGKIALTANSKGEVTVTNTYEHVDVTGKASFTLKKNISLDGEPCAVSDIPEVIASKEFEFVLSTLDGYETKYVIDANGTLGSDSQKYIFKVKPGETVDIYGLEPNRNYIVQERISDPFVQMDAYSLTAISINGADQPNFYNASTTVQTGSPDSNTEVETVNSYTTAKNDLVVKKEFKMNGNDIPADQLEHLDEIRLVVSGPNGYSEEITGRELRENNWTYRISSIPAGNYTITEINGDKTGSATYAFLDYAVSGSSPTRYNPGELTVTNTYKQILNGQLTLQKSVQANGVTTPSSFEVYIQNEEGKYYNPASGKFDPPAPGAGNNPTVTVPANGSISVTLPEGKYTVTEKAESAEVSGSSHVVSYKVGNEEGTNVVDLKNYGAQVGITNTYTKYSVKVTKKEAGDHMYNNWTYEFWIKDTTRTDGTYYIAKDGQSVRLQDGQDPYYFSIKAGDANSIEVPVKNAGDYQVIEKNENVAANNAYALVTTYSPAGGNVTLNDQNASSDVTITNTYEYINNGSLKITKNLTGGGADPNKVFDIEVVFSAPVKYSVDGAAPLTTASDTYVAHLKAGDSVVLSKIPAGITYTVTEAIDPADAAAGYSLTGIDGDTSKAIVKGEQNSVEVNNAYASSETIDLTVKKVWVDGNNQDGIRPASLEVTLLKDSAPYTTVTLSEGNNWTETVKDLPKYEGSRQIAYSWSEPSVAGYTSESSSETTGKTTTTTFTNTHVTEVTSASVLKVWDDKDNAAGKRPASLKVTLSNGTEVTLSDANNWTAKVENLPKYADGSLINYTWTEATLPAGYTMTGNAKDPNDSTLTVITNKYDLSVERVSVSVQKIWDDTNDAAGKRPANLKVTLSNGTEVTLNDANNWTAKVENLPKFDNEGNEIVYTWKEDDLPEGYDAVVSTTGTVTTITNTYDLSREKTSATVTKNWEDFNNVAGKRPADLEVTLSNGMKVTLNEANNWTATVENLQKFDDEGNEIVYTWKEDNLPEGYDAVASTTGTVTTITNTYDLSREKTSATVTKNWEDKDNIAGKRPTELKVTLSNGTEVTLNKDNNWTATVNELPKFDDAGNLIDYIWTEEAVTDYETTSSVSGNVTTITNTFDFTSVKIDLSVKKVWNDFDNVAGKRPVVINVNLMRDGQPLQVEELSGNNNWTVTIGNLNKYDENGNEHVYTWTEEANSEGYTMTGNKTDPDDPALTIITNTYDLSREKTSVSVQKIWDDKNDAAGKRPSSLKVTLSDGTEVILEKDNNWMGTVSDLQKYDSQGKEIVYTWIEEQLPAGYTMTGNAEDPNDSTLTVITNTYDLSVETVSVSVQKIWDDKNDAAEKRPSDLEVTLSNGMKVTLNEANNWTAKIENLPKFDDEGNEIAYTWKEDNLPEGYDAVASTTGTVTTITNTYDLSREKTTASVKKVWEDKNDVAGKRPTSLMVVLDNGTTEVARVILDDANQWSATIDDLEKFDSDGNEITYTWTEENLPEGYDAVVSITGTVTTITNTYDLSREKTTASVKKVWDDKDNAASKRPSSLKVTLNNGTEVTLSDANSWTAKVENLPKFDDQGKEIVYTWTEEQLPKGYVMTSSQTDRNDPTLTVITNTYDLSVETVSVSVLKIWDDKDDAASKRPSSLKVTLSNGTEVTLSDANSWTATLENLPKFDDQGNEIIYTWSEQVPDGYEMTGNEKDKNDATLTKITNFYDLSKETTSSSVTKVWEDKNNVAGKRPEGLSVILLQDGSIYRRVTLNNSNSWKASFDDLPKFDDTGKEYTYTWQEENLPAGYSDVTTSNGTDTTITNTYDLSTEKVSSTVEKIWDDSNNQDGKRPASVTVHLQQNGMNFGDAATLNEENSWTVTKTDLPKYDASGVEYVYTWEEDAVTAYTTTSSVSGDVTTITNAHEAEKTTLTVKKVWEHKTNAAANYPASVTVELYANNAKINEVTLNAANSWTQDVSDLPVYENGQPITYEWKEVAVANYNTTYAENAGVTTITNTFDTSTERTEATVKKVWDDSNDQDGKRPASVTVHLKQNGKNFGESITLNEANGWTVTKDDLPKYDASDNEYVYTWEEDAVADYTATSSVSGSVTTITNAHEAEKTTLTVKKVWEHKTNTPANYPDSVTVELYANSAKINEFTLNAANSWTQDVSDLPVYENGQPITYEWKETAVANYNTTYAENAGTTTITNTFDISTERTEATVKKVWDDSNDQDGKRPASVTVHLQQNGKNFGESITLNEANSWTVTKDDLPKYDGSGKEYAYTWEEDAVADYTATSSVSGTVTTLTNTHVAETTDLTVKKVWAGDTNNLSARPASVKVDFLVNGTVITSVELNESNNWTETLTGLAVYAGGQKITYEWKEVTVANYNTTYAENAGTTTITNTFDISTEKTEATVKKVWDDSNNQDGIRPASVTVHLKQNGVNFGDAVTLSEANSWTVTKTDLPKYDASGVEYAYAWEEDAVTDYTATSSVSGSVTTITNKHEAEKTTLTVKKVWEHKTNAAANYPASVTVELYANNAKINEVTLNAANSWTQDVSDLPVYENGQPITYEWKEVAVANYNTTYAENAGVTTITNTFDTSTERTEATVKKVWDDSNDQDGKRPASVTVHLKQNGANFGESITLNEANSWTATKTDLPKYDASGKEYAYTWEEDAVTDYTATSSVNGTVTTLTNTHVAEVVSVSVEKIWDDSNNQDGIRPASLDVTLQKNGADLKTVTLNDANSWTYTEANLPKNENGKAITYSWSEPSVNGYTSSKAESGNNTTLTNKHTAEVVSVTVEKVWDDSNNQDGIRPASLDVTLQKNGAELKTVTLNDANNWTYTEANLPKNENGKAITYSWSEPSVTGYTSSKTESGNKTTFTNKHSASVVSVTIVKVWDDSNNQDGIRPAELTVTLLKNGTDYSEVTLNEANSWTATVENLPAKNGTQENVYAWAEKTIPTGYTLSSTSTSGTVTTLTNTHAVEEVTLKVEKVWNDNGDIAGKRPSSLKVTLNADGAYYDEVTLDESNNWTASMTVPKYDNGTEVSYSWEEDSLPQGYTKTSAVNGNTTTLTNTYDLSSEKTSVTVKKVWDDNGNADGKRPSSLEMTLSNGTVVTLSEANNWTATVDDLAKYDASGVEITYTWTEGSMPQEYSKTGEETVGNTTTFTNTYTAPAPVLGSLKIEKILGADAPASATSKVYHFTVSGPNGYTKAVEIQGAGYEELTDLELGIYTVTEDEDDAKIDGYTLSVSNNGVSIEITDAAQKEVSITNNYSKKTEPTDTQPTDTNPTGTQPTSTAPSESEESSGTAPTEGPSEESPTPTPDKVIVSVMIDDQPVSPDDYKKKPDGTVEFTPETIEGLTLGVHRTVIKYNDGSTKTIEFEVISSARGKKIVKTGDVGGTDIVPVVSLFAVAVASVAIVIFRKRRSQKDEL